jgi:hypothetical protein
MSLIRNGYVVSARRGCRRWGEDHVDIHADKLGHQRGQLIDVLRPLPFDDDVGALDVAEVAQARPQALLCDKLRDKAEKPDSRQFRTLLRPHREWPTSRRAPEESDEVAALQLIELHRVTAGLGDHRIFDFTTGVCPVALHIRGLQRLIRDNLTMPVSLPVSPQLRTYSCIALTVAMGQKRKSNTSWARRAAIYSGTCCNGIKS